MNDYKPDRVITDREITIHHTSDGPRVRVVEHWSDGHTSRRFMGPKETAAHLNNQGVVDTR